MKNFELTIYDKDDNDVATISLAEFSSDVTDPTCYAASALVKAIAGAIRTRVEQGG